MAPYEGLYGQQCRSPIGWFELDETKALGRLDLVQDTLEKVKTIRGHIRTAQSRQKTYMDCRRHKLEFSVEGYGILEDIPDERNHEVQKERKVESQVYQTPTRS